MNTLTVGAVYMYIYGRGSITFLVPRWGYDFPCTSEGLDWLGVTTSAVILDFTEALDTVFHAIIESVSNDDGDGNENGKKAVDLFNKTTTLHVQHAFLYISLPSQQDYDVKMPNFTF